VCQRERYTRPLPPEMPVPSFILRERRERLDAEVQHVSGMLLRPDGHTKLWLLYGAVLLTSWAIGLYL
jgi:hypothetical protein